MTIAVVVGTFDYFHKGYLTTINKALEVADRVIVAIKKEGVFSQDIRKMEEESAYMQEGRLTTLLLPNDDMKEIESGIRLVINTFGGTLAYFVTANIDKTLFKKDNSVKKIICAKVKKVNVEKIEDRLMRWELERCYKYFHKETRLLLDVLANELIQRKLENGDYTKTN